MRDAVRYRLGWWASEPFWWVHLLGQRCRLISQRLVNWGERAPRGSQDPTHSPHPEDCLGCRSESAPLHDYVPPAKKGSRVCPGNDPTCPCQDGDACHYEGPDAWPIPESRGSE